MSASIAFIKKASFVEEIPKYDLNLFNEYNSTLNRKFHSAQKCSDEDLILLLADKRKLFRDFRAEPYIPANIVSQDKETRASSGF